VNVNFTLFNAFSGLIVASESYCMEDFCINKWRGLALLGKSQTGSPLIRFSRWIGVNNAFQNPIDSLEPQSIGFSVGFPLKKSH